MSLAFGGRKVADLSIGYSVDVDPRTGAGALRVPVPAPPGRHGLGPALTLAYASGAGNSAFGAGWSLAGLPAIGLDTRFHVPRWDGRDGYQLGGDELVPWLQHKAGAWTPRGFVDGDWSVAFLRSRRGSAQVRIEKWVHVPTGRVHFRTRDARNVVTIYGARPNAAARIADPDDETRTFAWLPELQIDPHGNALWLEYAAESLDGVDLSAPFERYRPSLAQRYLKRVRYANVAPLALDDALATGTLPASARWCLQFVLDYGDHADPGVPGAVPDRAWPARLDPFSSYRNGFEVRTYRLCRRFLAFHEFDELGAEPTLVGALVLTHGEDAAGSTLREIAYVGYRRDGGKVTSKAIPPLRMTYAPATIGTSFIEAPAGTQENLPAGLAGRRLTFVDLLGEGLPGILTESDRAWYYKPNLGGGEFGAQAMVLERPATRPGTFGFGDVDRDGDTDLSQLAGRLAGLYEFDREDAAWTGFCPFSAFPHVEALGGRAQWVDLNGDGRPDLVVVKADAIVWFASDGESFLPPVEIPRPEGADAAPTPAADQSLGFSFADMTGGGLPDLVRVQNGCVEYWPSLGNGHFGERVVMAGAPQFAPDDEFDAARLRFVDLDGSGTTDLVYLGHGEVTCWINAAGNQLVAGPRLAGLPYFDNVSSVRVLDFLADGRACLVWSSPLPGCGGPLEYLPLTPADVPRLLLSVDDSLGRETRLTYSSSSAHYLRDVAAGRGWSTRLPGHHLVIDRREVLDHIGNTRSVQRFEYHDGYYDGVERELRGFGQVDVYDADAALGTAPGPGAAAFAVPRLVRTWFHLGTPMWNHHRPHDTYAGDPDLPWLSPHVVDDADQMTPDEIEDGLRALAGQTIRREVYAVDEHGTPGPHPFEVSQQRLRLRRTQPARGDAEAAFSVAKLEDATWAYEQAPGDPRVRHHIVVETDDFDLPVRDAEVGYARREGRPRDVAAQARHFIAIHDHGLVNFDDPDRFELGIPVEGKSYELVGLRPELSGLYTREQLREPTVVGALAAPDPHHVDPPDDPTQGPRARLLSWDQSFYWNDARDAPLSLRQIGASTMVHHEEAACFAPAFVADALGGRADDARISALGYFQREGLWWQADEIHHFTPAAQFSQRGAIERADSAVTRFAYDAYALTITEVTDPLGNSTVGAVDYHQLAPWRLTDPNGNVSEVRYDPLGVVVAATSYGHAGGEAWGFDALDAVALRTPATLAGALTDPGRYLQGAARYIWYDLEAWSSRGSPTTALSLTREDLVRDGAGGGIAASRIHVGVAYLDSLGRALQEKALVEDGQAIQRDGQGQVIVDGGGRPVLAHADQRWRASGHVVYDGKQHPGRQYEPFFTPNPAYEGDDVLQHVGAPTLTRYDAIGRATGQDFPNGTFTATTFGPWAVEQADPNDTVIGSAYGALRQGLPADDPERQAYEQAKQHAGTTRLTYLDPLGREAGSRAQGGATAADRLTETHLDIEGQAREIIDPRGLTAFAYQRDMQGRLFHEHSIDAGDAWSLPDAHDRVITTWNGRGFEIERGYDLGDRPLYTHVRGGDGPAPLDHRVEQWVYGESLADPVDAARRNLLGRVATTRDSAGETSVDRYDPLGSALSSTRRLRADVDAEPDWRGAVPLEPDPYTTSAVYDALGRPRSDTLPDGTVRAYEYLPSGPLARVRVTTPDGTLVDTPILDGAAYGARGERQTLVLGNGVELQYGYDVETYRLATQIATRGGRPLQTIRYTHDPSGNLVRLTDDAQEGSGALIGGATVPARRDYVYDAHYRLRQATGRVHQALLQYDYIPGTQDTIKGTRHLSLNNGAAIERFTRTYDYDASGNLRYIKHVGKTQSWTTDLWISATSNRSLPALGPNGIAVQDPENKFDGAGNLREMSHLRQIDWTWGGALGRCVVTKRPGGTDDSERYVYAGDGLRARKVTTRVVYGGQVEITEKVYLGDSERKRIRLGNNIIFERWTTHVGDGGQRIALIHRWVKDDLAREVDDIQKPRIHYQLNTHQGSSALELDEAGNLISYEEYFPYGGTAFVAGDNLREVARREYRYSGKECDDFTNLYYYGYRYYAPWMGRWLSPDPIGPEDDLNLYQFVLGDPVGNVDRDGLDTTPGAINYIVRRPPAPSNDLKTGIANYRSYLGTLPGGYQQGFDTLSPAQQERLATGGTHVHLVPMDPAGLTPGWAVLNDAENKAWLAARQEYAEGIGKSVDSYVISNNPSRVPGSGGGDKDGQPHDSQTTPSGSAGSGSPQKDLTGGSKGQPVKRPGDGDGKSHEKGDGTGGNGRVQSTGGGAGVGPGGKGAGSGGPRIHGTGKTASDVYGDDFGGTRGGRSGGEVGGTPFSRGRTPGGQGDSPEPNAPTQPGLGREVQGDGPGLAAGGNPPLGPARGANPTRGEGPGGAGQDAQGRTGPTGWKSVLLDIAGMTNLEFGDGEPNGVEGGVPGGKGGPGGRKGGFWQWLYIEASIVNLVGLLMGLGEMFAGSIAALRGVARLGRSLITELPNLVRFGWRGLLRLARQLPDAALGLGRLFSRDAIKLAQTDFIAGAGRLGGELFPKARLKVLERYLSRHGVALKVGDKFVRPGYAGAFDSVGKQLLLKSNPTTYEVLHELSHYIQYKKLGPSAYQALSRVEREQFVFDMLQNSAARWAKLTYEQQQHAIEYILQVGGIR
jgi:RHS repeat-associated protein